MTTAAPSALERIRARTEMDRVLERLGTLLRGQIRAADTASRYGGEEFALILPESDEGEAKRKGRDQALVAFGITDWEQRYPLPE